MKNSNAEVKVAQPVFFPLKSPSRGSRESGGRSNSSNALLKSRDSVPVESTSLLPFAFSRLAYYVFMLGGILLVDVAQGEAVSSVSADISVLNTLALSLPTIFFYFVGNEVSKIEGEKRQDTTGLKAGNKLAQLLYASVFWLILASGVSSFVYARASHLFSESPEILDDYCRLQAYASFVPLLFVLLQQFALSQGRNDLLVSSALVSYGVGAAISIGLYMANMLTLSAWSVMVSVTNVLSVVSFVAFNLCCSAPGQLLGNTFSLSPLTFDVLSKVRRIGRFGALLMLQSGFELWNYYFQLKWAQDTQSNLAVPLDAVTQLATIESVLLFSIAQAVSAFTSRSHEVSKLDQVRRDVKTSVRIATSFSLVGCILWAISYWPKADWVGGFVRLLGRGAPLPDAASQVRDYLLPTLLYAVADAYRTVTGSILRAQGDMLTPVSSAAIFFVVNTLVAYSVKSAGGSPLWTWYVRIGIAAALGHLNKRQVDSLAESFDKDENVSAHMWGKKNWHCVNRVRSLFYSGRVLQNFNSSQKGYHSVNGSTSNRSASADGPNSWV